MAIKNIKRPGTHQGSCLIKGHGRSQTAIPSDHEGHLKDERAKMLTEVSLVVQSTLSKADTLGTKATVQCREVSALERVQLQIYKCNSAGSGPNLLSGLESVRLERVDCTQIVYRVKGKFLNLLLYMHAQKMM